MKLSTQIILLSVTIALIILIVWVMNQPDMTVKKTPWIPFDIQVTMA